jgi:hypothetical protein
MNRCTWMKFCTLKVRGPTFTYKSNLYHYLLWRVFKYGGISKLWGFVGTNAKLLRIEFRNFVHCHIFVSDLSFCFIKGVLGIRDSNTAAEKYSRLCRPVNLYLKSVTRANDSRLWFQSLDATFYTSAAWHLFSPKRNTFYERKFTK